MANAFLFAMAFILGAVIGSFLGVCISRIPAGEGVVFGRSHCPHCKRVLGAAELVPIVSFLALRGRCKGCKARIPARYVLVEALCGGLFVLSVLAFGLTVKAGVMALFYAVLLVVAFIDMDTMEIPNGAHICILALTVLSAALVRDVSLLDRAIGAVCVSLPFLAIMLIAGGFGGGDVKLMAVCGALLGWKEATAAALIGIVIGAAGGLLYKAAKGQSKMPFGPYLAVGLVAGSVVGEELINWYLSLL